MIIKYTQTKEFARDWKKLLKKFLSLPEDLKNSQRYNIKLFHEQGIDNSGIHELSRVGNTEELQFFKITKFPCKSLKGRGAKSGLRIIYAYFPKKQAIVFIEIYFKADQGQEDRSRIVDFIDSNSSEK